MRKVNEVVRLKASGLSNRQIAKSCNIARSTVADYLERVKVAGLSWTLPPEMDEDQLDARLFREPETRGRDAARPVPDWAVIHKELRRKSRHVEPSVAGIPRDLPRWLWVQPVLRTAPRSLLAEFLTLRTGFSYGSLRNRGLYVAQQTCCPGLGKANSYWLVVTIRETV
jgi:hypothetical protein